MKRPRCILKLASEVDEAILAAVAQCAEERFPPGTTMPVDEFIDRLCDDYARGWDIEEYDCPAARKIMRHARSVRREMT